MDKNFWASLSVNEFKIPDGHSLDGLTHILFGYLASTDPELRDDIAYVVYANWLKQNLYSPGEVQAHVTHLLANLDLGIGDTDSDTVFLRTFSVLLLAEIVHNDNKRPVLEVNQIKSILAKALWYLDAEQDPRGHIPVKGWAHALAHTADLMMVLGKNRHTETTDHEQILQAIAKKLITSTNWLYIHGEDDRLANAVVAIFERNLISSEFIKLWLSSFASPERSWVGAYMDEDLVKAFHNTRNFLRSLSEAVRSAESLTNKEAFVQLAEQASTSLKPY